MKNLLGTLGLLGLFCKFFSFVCKFHSTNKYSHFLIVSNKFAIRKLFSHVGKNEQLRTQKNAARSITPLAAI